MLKTDIYVADFQVCMLGGDRDKWRRIVANFRGITVLNIKCDRSHTHLPWGFAKDQLGQQVWATSLESQYPRKMCITLVNTVLHFASQQGLKLRANSLLEDNNPLLTMQRAQIGAQQQPKPSKILPVVPDSVDLALIPSALMAKLPHDIQLYTKSGLLEVIPKFSRYLRFSRLSAHQQGGDSKGQHNELLVTSGDFSFEVAFGLPWNFSSFISRACQVGHPALATAGVPAELEAAVEANVNWKPEQLARYRIEWCRKWMRRSEQLEALEKKDAEQRHPNVASIAAGKRILLTREMLEEIQYPGCWGS